MHDPAFQIYYEEKKKHAREVYNKIGRVWCPALVDHVSFESHGFRHLIWKGGKRRPYAQQIKRFSLISYAAQIVSDPGSQIIKREEKRYSQIKRHGVKMTTEYTIHFWAFRKAIYGKDIRVIVQKVDDGHKHFLSIFEEEK